MTLSNLNQLIISCSNKIRTFKTLKCNKFFEGRIQHILRLYGVGHMVKDHSDSERGNPLPPHGLLFPINSNGSFICTIPQDSTYHSLCYTSCGALAGMRNSTMSERSYHEETCFIICCLITKEKEPRYIHDF